jgi:hypothetical protein
MGRKKIVRRGVIKQFEEEMRRDKGRKKEWQPRGELIPPNKTHAPKKGPYKRAKFNWKEFVEE